jgi:hypothetical protein
VLVGEQAIVHAVEMPRDMGPILMGALFTFVGVLLLSFPRTFYRRWRWNDQPPRGIATTNRVFGCIFMAIGLGTVVVGFVRT